MAVLSLDGWMAADLKTDRLQKGDLVTVSREDGKVLEGKVSEVAGDTATVLVSDNGPRYGEKVTVSTMDGTSLGSAELYIHTPLGIAGYAGTVQNVIARENMAVSAGSALFGLKDTRFSANYDTLLRNRSDLEETLMELLTIYRDGALLAPIDGVVSSVQTEKSDESAAAPAVSDAASLAALYGYGSADTAVTVPAAAPGGILTLYPDLRMTVTIGIVTVVGGKVVGRKVQSDRLTLAGGKGIGFFKGHQIHSGFFNAAGCVGRCQV
jgi:hypothetical protein